MANFKAGDRVVHASGSGPEMIVLRAFDGFEGSEIQTPMCECEYWSEGQGKFIRERFPQTSLKLVSVPDGTC
ncbi:hypothetical protein RTE01_14520 [Raoultella terrigena]|nr:hypothetical protein RTE01_14520 [Raoultella terrigena]